MRKMITDFVKIQVLVTCTVMFCGEVVAVFVAVGNMGHSIIHTLSRKEVNSKFHVNQKYNSV